MKKARKIVACGLGLSLVFAQGFTLAEAKGKPVIDKNKNGIADNWEKKYKLSGKSIQAQDNDKDGLNNLVEYKLNLDPKKADTDKDGVADGQEDSDKDGLSNLAEGDFSFNPADPDTDKDKIKDGDEQGKDGIKCSDKVLELEIEIKTAHKKKIEIEYEVKKGKPHVKIKDQSRTITKEMVTSLVSELQAPTNMKEEEVVEKLRSLLKIEGSFKLEVEVEYANGEKIEMEQEIEADKGEKNDQAVQPDDDEQGEE